MTYLHWQGRSSQKIDKHISGDRGASFVEATILIPVIGFIVVAGLFLGFGFSAASFIDSAIDDSLLQLAIQQTLQDPNSAVPPDGCPPGNASLECETEPNIPCEPCFTVETARQALRQKLLTLFSPNPDSIFSLPALHPNVGTPNPQIIIPIGEGSAYREALTEDPVRIEAAISVNLGSVGTFVIERGSSIPRFAEQPVNTGNDSLPSDCAGNPRGSALFGTIPCQCQLPEIFNPIVGDCFLCPDPLTPEAPPAADIPCQDSQNCWFPCRGRHDLQYCTGTPGSCACPSPYNQVRDTDLNEAPSGSSCVCSGGDPANPGFVTDDSCRALCTDPACLDGTRPSLALAAVIPGGPPGAPYPPCKCECPNDCSGNVRPELERGCHCDLSEDCNFPFVFASGRCVCRYDAGYTCPDPTLREPSSSGCSCVCRSDLPPCGLNADRDTSDCKCKCDPGYEGDPLVECVLCNGCPPGTSSIGGTCLEPLCSCDNPNQLFDPTTGTCVDPPSGGA